MNCKYIVIPKYFATDEVNEFRKSVINLVNKGEINFFIDFSECEFIDCTGLGVLLSIYKKCMKINGSFKLCKLNTEIERIFKLTRLDRILLERI